MKKVQIYVLMLLLLVGAINGCKKESIFSKTETIDIRPDNIIGKRLLFNGDSYDVSGFTSRGTCTIPSGLRYGFTHTITKSPTYTYELNSLNASFICNYSEKCTFAGSSSTSYTNFDVKYTLTLTFTTTTTGTLTGSVNFIKTAGNNPYQNSMHFNFTDKPFTLE